MRKFLFYALSGLILTGLAGCLNVNARLPEQVSVGGDEVYSAPPPAGIAPANPNNKDDLLRENDQLRQRADYLDNHIRKFSRKYQDQQEQMAQIRADINKIARERDRYKRGLGQ